MQWNATNQGASSILTASFILTPNQISTFLDQTEIEQLQRGGAVQDGRTIISAWEEKVILNKLYPVQIT